jgi:hypothetical protein
MVDDLDKHVATRSALEFIAGLEIRKPRICVRKQPIEGQPLGEATEPGASRVADKFIKGEPHPRRCAFAFQLGTKLGGLCPYLIVPPQDELGILERFLGGLVSLLGFADRLS